MARNHLLNYSDNIRFVYLLEQHICCTSREDDTNYSENVHGTRMFVEIMETILALLAFNNCFQATYKDESILLAVNDYLSYSEVLTA